MGLEAETDKNIVVALFDKFNCSLVNGVDDEWDDAKTKTSHHPVPGSHSHPWKGLGKT